MIVCSMHWVTCAESSLDSDQLLPRRGNSGDRATSLQGRILLILREGMSSMRCRMELPGLTLIWIPEIPDVGCLACETFDEHFHLQVSVLSMVSGQ